MLRRDSEESMQGSAQTVIGPSVKVEGDLHAVGNVMVEGMLNGTLKTDKDATIGSKAKIVANMQCQNAVVAGVVQGNMQIQGHLEIKSTANIQGDINTKTIAIESGASINGKLSMGEGKPQNQAKEESSQQK